MNAETFELKLFTPSGLLLERRVSAVTLPAADGEIGILPLHIRYVGLLGTGILNCVDGAGNSTEKFVVASGFCTFEEDRLTILADFVQLAEAPISPDIKAEKEALSAELSEANAWNAEVRLIEDRIKRIEAIERLHAH